MDPQKLKLKEIYDTYNKDPSFDHMRSDEINFVPGRGPLNPRILLIGEAPGSVENALGKPFVGPAGKKLEEILREVSIDPEEDVFYSNVVKYWPRTVQERRTRAPNEAEITASKVYLLKEIEIINPLFVGLCGRISIQTIFPNIPSVRSQQGKLLNGRYVPLYHPAVILYREEKRREVITGYQILRSLIDAKELI